MNVASQQRMLALINFHYVAGVKTLGINAVSRSKDCYCSHTKSWGCLERASPAYTRGTGSLR